MSDPFVRFGITRVLNAAGTLTRLGGANVASEVAAAMAAAASASVDIVALQAAASRRIAKATGAEAGLVTTGASAALTLAAAAVIAGSDPARMERLPDTAGMPNAILMARTHRNGYDRALRTAGARIVDIGTNDRGTGAGIRGLEAWEIEAAISPATVGIAFSANRTTLPDLPRIVAVADRHKLPVIVDAAAQLPPKQNLHRFIGEGAALVAFSGGKAIGGPQASGILAGRRDLVASALLQQVDMDVDPDAFSAPPEFFGNAPPTGTASAAPKGGIVLPRHGIGRGFKASKEAIAGLLTALDLFLARDEAAMARDMLARLGDIAGRLDGVTGLTTAIVPAGMPRAYPRLAISLGDGSPLGARALAHRLRAAPLPVHLAEDRIEEGTLIVDLICVAPADDAALASAIRTALGRS